MIEISRVLISLLKAKSQKPKAKSQKLKAKNIKYKTDINNTHI